MAVEINKAFVNNLVTALNKGLGFGLGSKPGDFCVEQCVSIAEAKAEDPDLDIEGCEFSDGPTCVDSDLRSFKINLNDDLNFSSNKDRASALRRIAVAQLGTAKKFDLQQFLEDVQVGIDKLLKPTVFKLPITTITTKEDLQELTNYLAKSFGDSIYSGLDELQIPGSEAGRLDDGNDPSGVFQSVIDQLAKNEKQRKAVRNQLIEIAVQALVKQKTPGSKYLKLVATPKTSPKKGRK